MSRYQLLPPLSEEEYAALKADIAARGVMIAVEYDEAGHILDGHHRVQICAELGIKDFPSTIRPGLSEAEKRGHVRALNLHRRHLTRQARWTLIAEQLKETPHNSDRQIAHTLQVSDKTVGAVRKELQAGAEIPHVESRAGKDGKHYPTRRPAIAATTMRERERAFAALEETPISSLPARLIDVRRAERIERRHKHSLPSDHPAASHCQGEAIELRLGDFRQVLSEMAPESIPLIVTDPPYAAEFLPLWNDLAAFADRVLCPGGILVSYSGKLHLPTVLTSLCQHLRYIWTVAVYVSGTHPVIHPLKMHSRWRPVLVFAKPPFVPKGWVHDYLAGAGQEKGLHKWQQAEAEIAYFIEAFSAPGDTILDPFCGSGTTGAAAIRTGRRFIGCDIDPTAFATASQRLQVS